MASLPCQGPVPGRLPPLRSRANAHPAGSWSKALGETGPRTFYYAKGRGKDRDLLCEEAIWDLVDHPEVDELAEEDRALVCATGLEGEASGDFPML